MPMSKIALLAGRADSGSIVSTTHGNTELTPTTAAYVREMIARWLRGEGPAPPGTKRSKAALAALVGVTKTTIGSIVERNASIGLRVATGMARVFEVTLDQLEADAAREFADKFGDASASPSIRVVRDERYPNLAAVLSVLEPELDPAAVATTRSVAMSSPTDKPRLWWVRRLLLEQEEVVQRRADPATFEAQRDESESTSDKAQRKIEEARAKKPKRRATSADEE